MGGPRRGGSCIFCDGKVLLDNKDTRIFRSIIKKKKKGDIPESVDAELDSFFVVRRLLNLGDEVCCGLLREWGRPACWGVDLCSSCHSVVVKAKDVVKIIAMLEQQLEKLKSQLETKIVSLPEDAGVQSKRGSLRKQNKSAVQCIRETIAERCRVSAGHESKRKIKPEVEQSESDDEDSSSFCCFPVESFEETGPPSPEIPQIRNSEMVGNSTTIDQKVLVHEGKSTSKKRVTGIIIRQIEESPEAAATRMTNFLKSSSIVKNLTAPDTPKRVLRSRAPRIKKKKCLMTPTNTEPLSIEKISKETKDENSLAQGVDSFLEELQKDIESSHNADEFKNSLDSKDESEVVSRGESHSVNSSVDSSVVNVMGMEVIPDAQKSEIPVTTSDSEESEENSDSNDDDYDCGNESDMNASPSRPKRSKKKVSSLFPTGTKKKKSVPVFTCCECELSLFSQLALELHLLYKHSKYYCPECKVCCDTWDGLDSHTKAEHPNISARFLCNHCPKRYVKHEKLLAHLRAFHEVNIPKSRRRPYSLNPKVSVDVQCEDCGKIFKSGIDLASHKRLTHPTEDQKICKYCNEMFETMPKLMLHLRMNHSLEKSHMCEQCPRTFASERQLAHHQNREHGVPFPKNLVDPQRTCEECGKVFCRGKALSRHKLTVHGNPDKNFLCQKQGCRFKSFTEQELKRHVLYVHEKAQRPKQIRKICPECGNSFCGNHARDVHLRNVHGRTDIAVKVYELPCTKCPKKFRTRRSLWSHLNRVHGEENDLSIFPKRVSEKPRIRKRKNEAQIEDNDQKMTVEETTSDQDQMHVQYFT